jgi:hypothetical protein
MASTNDKNTYTKLLLGKGCGYPLWNPQPSTRPPEYRKHGVRIGDVGYINDQGAFNYLFTIAAGREDSRNSMLLTKRIKDSTTRFKPVDLDRDEDGIREWPHAFSREHCVSTETNLKRSFDASAQARYTSFVKECD